jgi:hypothetical protein
MPNPDSDPEMYDQKREQINSEKPCMELQAHWQTSSLQNYFVFIFLEAGFGSTTIQQLS